MTATLTHRQTVLTVHLLADALRLLDEQILALSQGNHEEAGLDPDDLPDLVEQYEQGERLRERLISHLNGTPVQIWECTAEGCHWLNRLPEMSCEQCGQSFLSIPTQRSTHE